MGMWEPEKRRREEISRGAKTHRGQALETRSGGHGGELPLDEILDSLDVVVRGKGGPAGGTALELGGLDPDRVLIAEVEVDLRGGQQSSQD